MDLNSVVVFHLFDCSLTAGLHLFNSSSTQGFCFLDGPGGLSLNTVAWQSQDPTLVPFSENPGWLSWLIATPRPHSFPFVTGPPLVVCWMSHSWPGLGAGGQKGYYLLLGIWMWWPGDHEWLTCTMAEESLGVMLPRDAKGGGGHRYIQRWGPSPLG